MNYEHQLLTISVPKSNNVFVGYDRWKPLEGLERIHSDDKLFIQGFAAALQLNDGQWQMLLTDYATRYREALSRAGRDNPRRETKAKQAANSWIREGGRGYVKRQ